MPQRTNVRFVRQEKYVHKSTRTYNDESRARSSSRPSSDSEEHQVQFSPSTRKLALIGPYSRKSRSRHAPLTAQTLEVFRLLSRLGVGHPPTRLPCPTGAIPHPKQLFSCLDIVLRHVQPALLRDVVPIQVGRPHSEPLNIWCRQARAVVRHVFGSCHEKFTPINAQRRRGSRDNR